MNALKRENDKMKKKILIWPLDQKNFKGTTVGTSREPHGQKNNGPNARRTDAAPYAELSYAQYNTGVRTSV